MLHHYVTQMLAQAFLSVRDAGKVNKIPSLSPVSDYVSPHVFPLNSQRLEIFKIFLHFKTYQQLLSLSSKSECEIYPLYHFVLLHRNTHFTSTNHLIDLSKPTAQNI